MSASIVSSINKSYQGKNIRVNPVDRYVCLTDMAKASGKLVKDWVKLDSTNLYLEALSEVGGIPLSTLLSVSRGNPTWAHPKVAIKFAAWCSPHFEVQVTTWIDELMTTGSVSIAPQASAESLAQWHKDRTDGKEVRRTLSDAIAMFVRYAQAQGSKNADRYFASITHNLINRYVIEAPIDSKIRDKRNRMDREQLRHLTNIEDVLSGLIEARMMAGDDYHEIYQVCKDRAAAIAAVLDISPKPLLPESNQRLINQSLARSLAS